MTAGGPDSAHKVDGRSPHPATATITSVAVTSTPAHTSSGASTPDTYGRGETIEITLTLSQAVTVAGDPEFRFSLAVPGQPDNEERAAYDEDRSTATTVVFTYEVEAQDRDPNGIWIGNHRRTFLLDDNDRIRTTSQKIDIDLSHDSPGTLSGHKVDGSLDPPASTLSALALSNAADGSAIALTPPFEAATDAYTTTVRNTVSQVTVAATAQGSDARVAYLDDADDPLVDAAGDKTGLQVDLAEGANVIKVRVTADGNETDGLYTLTVTRAAAGVPGVTGVTVSSTPVKASDTYGAREHIEFSVAFDAPVTVTGTPELTFQVGGGNRTATYYAGSGTSTLLLSYAVAGGSSDRDTDGISWNANALGLGSDGMILQPGTTTPAVLHHAAGGPDSAHKVDGRSPHPATATITSVAVTSTPGSSRREPARRTPTGGARRSRSP